MPDVSERIKAFSNLLGIPVTALAEQQILLSLQAIGEDVPVRFQPRQMRENVQQNLTEALPGLLELLSLHPRLLYRSIYFYLDREFEDRDLFRFLKADSAFPEAWQTLEKLNEEGSSLAVFIDSAIQWAVWKRRNSSYPIETVHLADVFHFQYYFHDWLSALVWIPPFKR